MWKRPPLINHDLINNVGKFTYRVICKSGFIVLVIIFITYFICMHSPSILAKENSVKKINVGEVVKK